MFRVRESNHVLLMFLLLMMMMMTKMMLSRAPSLRRGKILDISLEVLL